MRMTFQKTFFRTPEKENPNQKAFKSGKTAPLAILVLTNLTSSIFFHLVLYQRNHTKSKQRKCHGVNKHLESHSNPDHTNRKTLAKQN